MSNSVSYQDLLQSVDLESGEVFHNPEVGYNIASVIYLQRGFEPIPVRGKLYPPKGATGHAGTVTPEKVSDWQQQRPSDNTALRAGETWISIDVDHGYDGKTGADSIRELEATLGPLPFTVTSTARGAASESRQRFYRIPAGMRFVSKPCKDVEVVQRDHRYAVVAPSVHPITGTEYTWYGPDGKALADLPVEADFAELPEAWVEHLETTSRVYASGEAFSAGDLEVTKHGLDRGTPGTALLEEFGDLDLTQYDDASSALWRLSYWVINRGTTPGLGTVLDSIYEEHLDAASSRGRDEDQRRADLDRSLSTALGKRREALDEVVSPEALAWVSTQLKQVQQTQEAAASFWDRRPVLSHVRDTAHKRILDPWGLLGALIQRALMDVPYNITYASALGNASLNQVCAFVGETGGGKSQTQKTLQDAFGMNADAYRAGVRKPGSGEGVSDAYRAWTKDEATGDKVLSWTTWNHAILWGFDEVGSLVSQQKRTGATILETIKEAESGSTLTRSLSQGNTSELPGGEYRFLMFMNVQPAKAEALVDDSATAGGLPGRILWMPTQSKTAREDYAKVAGSPVTKLTVKAPQWFGTTTIQALPEMNEAHIEANISAHEGKRDAMESHASLLRAKVAIALMALDSRTFLTAEDWELAGIVMDKSKETRDGVLEAVKKAAVKANADQGKREGMRRVTARNLETSDLIDQAVTKLAALPPEERKKSRLTARLRPYYLDAKERLDAQQA